MQWEQTLLGLQDYELLHSLKSELARAEQTHTTTAAEGHHGQDLVRAVAAARVALADVSKVTFGLSHVRPANDITYTLDVNILDKVRRRVQESILDLGRYCRGA